MVAMGIKEGVLLGSDLLHVKLHARSTLPTPQPRALVIRGQTFPIAVQAPWGISPALLPQIPLPTKIRTAFQDPISLDCDPDRPEDDAYVEAEYHEVRSTIQDGMDAPARRRRLPLFG
jgi:hypothetical protein